jgi:hypothetical protein
MEMYCYNYSTEGSSVVGDMKSMRSTLVYGSSQSDVYNWMSDSLKPLDFEKCTIIEVKFKGFRKEFYLNLKNIVLKSGQLVVVEGNMSGYDVGHVSLTGELVRLQLKKKKVRTGDVVKEFYHIANAADITQWKQAKELELYTLLKARVLVKNLNLLMKLTDVDYQADLSKATFYYTAEGRVDYRVLIKHLSQAFGVRIEMRQIGLREEANRIGDIGPCGSHICCHTWSTNFKTEAPFAASHKKKSRWQGNRFECYIKDESPNISSAKRNEGANKTLGNRKALVAKSLLYPDVVGQDSITRFDAKEETDKK